MIGLEVCVNADDLQNLERDVQAARQGGAVRIELCGQMQLDGLTPSVEAMHIARDAFADVPGMLVMIRPRGGDFCYAMQDLLQMQESLYQAAECGADGVVFGLLNAEAELDLGPLKRLVDLAHQLSLPVTFHRAFDALRRPEVALEQLIDLGVRRILSAGAPWDSRQGVTAGLQRLGDYIAQAKDRIEVVAGGGIHLHNLAQVYEHLAPLGQCWSVHSYSALLEEGRVSQARVAEMTARCGPAN
ncbi:hypothetical protein GCM10009092_00920 [Bowmanella denitrificans]|uniref:Copper homeostasis protein cutC homolog n=1 Tax=Bowmanella denitrificans TaxID=366582 RepID=A0ABP3G9Z2_9ALTE